MTRKDKFIAIVASLWALSSVVVFVAFSMYEVVFVHIVFSSILAILLCIKPFITWLNQGDLNNQ